MKFNEVNLLSCVVDFFKLYMKTVRPSCSIARVMYLGSFSVYGLSSPATQPLSMSYFLNCASAMMDDSQAIDDFDSELCSKVETNPSTSH